MSGATCRAGLFVALLAGAAAGCGASPDPAANESSSPITANGASLPDPPAIHFPVAGDITSGRPQITFATAKAARASTVEICRDAACSQVVVQLSGASSVTPETPLPRGTYFVRGWGTGKDASGNVVAGAPGTPREIRSNGSSASSRAPLGTFADFDADGLSDTPSVTADPVSPTVAIATSTADTGLVSFGGTGSAWWLAVPDMDGDGRTELAVLDTVNAATSLSISHLDPVTNAVVRQPLAVAPYPTLLSLGDVNRDGYADLGLVQTLPTGARVEVVYGAANAAFTRTTYDLVLPMEGSVQAAYASISAIGDINDDGYPDIAVGGTVASTVNGLAPSPTIPRAGIFLNGLGDEDRFYVFLGAARQPYTKMLDAWVSEGRASAGLSPVGDVDGDGVMDTMGVDTAPTAWVSYTPDPNTPNYWTLTTQSLRGGVVYETFGGKTMRKAQFPSPSFFREGPAAAGDATGLIEAYSDGDVPGVRTVTGDRTREDYYFDVSVTGAGDLDGDGHDDIAFSMSGAEQPTPAYGESWDTFSTPDCRRTYSWADADAPGGTETWTRFAAFVDPRYGSATGAGQATTTLLFDPTTERNASLMPWVTFPATVEAHANGLLVGESVESVYRGAPQLYPFVGTYAGPAGALTLVP